MTRIERQVNDMSLITRESKDKYEEELRYLTLTARKEVAQKIKDAREQGDLSENAEYDAAKEEQGKIESRIVELEELLKNAEVVDVEVVNGKVTKVSFGCTVVVTDLETKEDIEFKIVGASEASTLDGKISNESPIGVALMGAKKGETVEVECPAGVIQYKVKSISVQK